MGRVGPSGELGCEAGGGRERVATSASAGASPARGCPSSSTGSAARQGRSSEHPVVVGGVVGDDLQDIPVLDDLAVGVEAEDVDAGVVVVAGPGLMAVQDDMVTLGNRANEPHPLARVV